MPLPNPGMSFTPFDPLPASDLNDMVENIEALQDWSAFDSGSLPLGIMPNGVAVQLASQGFAATATGTTVIPADNTIPQNTEGTEFATLSITPKSATNILVIEANMFCSLSTVNAIIGALFQDSVANALSAAEQYQATNTGMVMLRIVHRMVAGTTSATTFKVRLGGSGAGTLTLNGASGSQRYSTTPKSAIIITEYKAS